MEWTVGAECALEGRAFGRSHTSWGPIEKVEKLYKNGNVVIGGQQFRPMGDTAHQTGGGSRWSGNMYRLMTDEHRARRAADIEFDKYCNRVWAAMKTVERMAKTPEDFPVDLLRAIERAAPAEVTE